MNKWNDSSLSLGERCVEFAKNEMANGVAEDKPNSFTSPRIREYFKICTRLVNGKESPIGLSFSAGNWCAAGVSFTLFNCMMSEDPGLPHGFRLGVIEIISDMQKKKLYHPVDEVKRGLYKIKVGDPIFFDRSNPNNPDSKWWRHIGLVYSVGENGKFVCISGNNGGKWRLSDHTINQATLLGFGDYPSPHAPHEEFDPSTIDLKNLAPLQDTGKNLGITSAFSFITKIFK